ncbi:MAG: hypothetical protein J0L92_22300 [Deltaproteobacteria bacterium]|nr:hypothetical protein [Deltaproteobacteria bacterium]
MASLVPHPLSLSRSALVGALVVLTLLATLTGCDARPCDAAALTNALASARDGETVEVGACRIAGAFTIPDGVTLSGVAGSVLASVDDRAVLEASGRAFVRGLDVEVDHGGFGVIGRGELSIEDVEVRVTRGVGIGVEAASLTATRVSLDGPITDENADFAAMSAAETGTFGLVARGLTRDHTITLDDVHVSDFAVAGVSIGGGVLTWQGRDSGPDVEGVRGVGLAIFGTIGAVFSLEVAGMRSGVGMPGIGVVASPLAGEEAQLLADELSVHDGDGYGLFGDGSAISLRDGRFADLGLIGVRVQGGLLDAEDLVAERNGGAGVLAIDTESVRIERGRLDAQRESLFVTMLGSARIADGLQVVRDPMSADAPPLDLTLVGVSLSDNARAGLLLDASDGAIATLRIEDVTVSATGTSLGAITQRASVAAGWDAMITRAGAAAANDAAFSTPIDVVGIMMPPGLIATPPPF